MPLDDVDQVLPPPKASIIKVHQRVSHSVSDDEALVSGGQAIKKRGSGTGVR